MNRATHRMIAAALASLLAGSAFEGARAEDEPLADPMIYARGAQTWAEVCARCHNMRDAAELRDDQWRAVVAHMRLRAGLTASESQAILRFLQESN